MTEKEFFLDTETTSLDAGTGEVWEVAGIERIYNDDGTHTETEYVWQLPVFHLHTADPQSLRINKYHQRRWRTVGDDDRAAVSAVVGTEWSDTDNQAVVPIARLDEWARNFVAITYDAHLIGNVISFDEERLRRLLLSLGEPPMWHYHIVDVEPLIAGRLALPPPWRSKELSEAIGILVPKDQHTAIADARWARNMYDQIMTGAPLEGWARDVHDGLLRMREDES